MLRLFHDFTSPASALAWLRLRPLVAEGLAVALTGIDALGLDRAVPPTVGLLEELDEHRSALRAEGLHPRRPAIQPPTLRAHLVTDLAREAGRAAAWREACYRGYWEEGLDLSEHSALVDLAARVGLEGAADRLADEAAGRALRRRMAAYRGRGVGGVPVLEVDGTLVPALLDPDELRRLAAL